MGRGSGVSEREMEMEGKELAGDVEGNSEDGEEDDVDGLPGFHVITS